MAQNYFTLDKCIRELLVKSGEDTEHKYGLYNLHAHTFLLDFINDTARIIKTVRLPMGTDRSVMLPADYIDWVKVGIEDGDTIEALSYNQNMNKLAEKKTLAGTLTNYINEAGEHCGEVSCKGEFQPIGDFIVDDHTKIMRFHSTVTVQDVYLEYIGSNIEVCGEIPIHPYAKTALELFIKWQEALYKKQHADAREFERQYYNERRKLNGRMQPFTLDNMLDILARNFNQNLR